MSGVIHRKDLDRLMYWLVNVTGVGGAVGDVFFTAAAAGVADTQLKKIGVDSDHRVPTFAAAYASCTSERNDIIVVSPEECAVVAPFTFSKNNAHVVGMNHAQLMQHPSYFSHTVATDVMFTVSGHHNSFHNMRWKHGTDSATNAHCVEVTGVGNGFDNCHFDSPYSPIGTTNAECAVSGFDVLKIGTASNALIGSFTTFKKCTFGNPYALMTDVSALVGFTGNAWWQSIFDDCLFIKRCGNTTNLFLHTYQTPNTGCFALFRNCGFVNCGTHIPQFAIDGYAMNVKYSQMVFINSPFPRCTDVIAATYESNVWFNVGQAHDKTGTDNFFLVGLAQNPDVE